MEISLAQLELAEAGAQAAADRFAGIPSALGSVGAARCCAGGGGRAVPALKDLGDEMCVR